MSTPFNAAAAGDGCIPMLPQPSNQTNIPTMTSLAVICSSSALARL
jgi:hypothetical protein